MCRGYVCVSLHVRAGGGLTPGHHGVPSPQGGGVQLEDGGDLHAIGDGHQRVHHLPLGRPETGTQGLVIRVQLDIQREPVLKV